MIESTEEFNVPMHEYTDSCDVSSGEKVNTATAENSSSEKNDCVMVLLEVANGSLLLSTHTTVGRSDRPAILLLTRQDTLKLEPATGELIAMVDMPKAPSGTTLQEKEKGKA